MTSSLLLYLFLEHKTLNAGHKKGRGDQGVVVTHFVTASVTQ